MAWNETSVKGWYFGDACKCFSLETESGESIDVPLDDITELISWYTQYQKKVINETVNTNNRPAA
jgi:hypothetical protein